MDAIGNDALTSLNYPLSHDDTADALAEQWPDFINDIDVEVTGDGVVDITIDPAAPS